MKKNFMIFITCAIVIPSFLVNIIASMFFVSYMTKRVENNYKYIFEVNHKNAKDMLWVFESMLNKIVSNTKIKDGIKELETAETLHQTKLFSENIDVEVQNVMFSDSNADESIYNITIYPIKKNTVCMGQYVSAVENINHTEWFRTIKSDNDFMYIDNKFGKNILSIAAYIYSGESFADRGRELAVVRVEIDASLFLKNIQQENEELSCIELYDDNTEEIIRYGERQSNTELKNSYIVEGDFIDNKWKLRYIYDIHKEKNIIRLIMSMWIIIGILLVLIDIFVIYKFSNMVNARLKHILDKIQHIQKGEWRYRTKINDTDEFSQIDEQLNHMSVQIENIIEEKYVAEIEKNKAELNTLKLQINPHFMYNTLESISSIAREENCDEIITICNKMSAILRYSLSEEDSKRVVLSDEIKLVDDYYLIQKIRFGDRINVYYDIPTEFENVKVIKFLLQPLVENVVKHIISKDLEKHLIVISAKESEGILQIEVIDDGDGMDEEKKLVLIENVLSNDFSSGEKIGLKNINRRLKLVFGEMAGITIESMKNIGTKIIVKLPIEEGRK